MNDKDYWIECIASAAQECALDITSEQLDVMAEGVRAGHEYYGMAFYAPPSGDRIAAINREWEERFNRLQQEFDNYRNDSETAIKKALSQYPDANIGIGNNGEVTRYGGRTEIIQS